MIDKDLLRLLGGNKKYIAFCVGLMVLGCLRMSASLHPCAGPLRLPSGTTAVRVFFWHRRSVLVSDWRFAMPPLALSGI